MNLDYLDKRNKDLVRTQKTILQRLGENAPYVSRRYIIRLICLEPAERFYISQEEVARALSQLRQCHPIKRQGNKQKMYKELFAIYKKLAIENPETGQVELIEKAILSPASGFFLTEKTIREYLNRIR